MKITSLIFLLITFFISNVYSREISVDLLKIQLNATEALGVVRVHGGLNVLIDSSTNEFKSLNSEFLVKAIGIGLGKKIINSYDVVYNEFIALIQGDNVVLPGFNKELVLTSMVINEPEVINQNLVSYNLSIYFLRSFGIVVPKECQENDLLKFTILQNDHNLEIKSSEMQGAITEVKLYVHTLGKDKRLSHIELLSLKEKRTINYKNCQRVKK